MAKTTDKKKTYVAELTVTHPGGTETAYGFDKAWRLAKSLELPVHIHFVRLKEAK